jgi:hypothetical protein
MITPRAARPIAFVAKDPGQAMAEAMEAGTTYDTHSGLYFTAEPSPRKTHTGPVCEPVPDAPRGTRRFVTRGKV